MLKARRSSAPLALVRKPSGDVLISKLKDFLRDFLTFPHSMEYLWESVFLPGILCLARDKSVQFLCRKTLQENHLGQRDEDLHSALFVNLDLG